MPPTYVFFHTHGQNEAFKPLWQKLKFEVVNVLGAGVKYIKWESIIGPYGVFEITSDVSADQQERLRTIEGIDEVKQTDVEQQFKVQQKYRVNTEE